MNLSQRSEQYLQPRVLVCDPIHADAVELLRKHAHVDVIDGPKLNVAALEESIGSYDAVINRSRTAIPASVINKGKHLRAIVRAGTGLDNIDVEAARQLGITVGNCPGANSTAVAEHTLTLMLGLCRHLGPASQSMRDGQWLKSKFMGEELHGKTLGIIGFGSIGRLVASRAMAFDMKVVVNQNRMTPELANEWRVENMDLYALLGVSDFVTLHVPLRKENIGLIGERELASMKPTSYLINTSRGGLIDEDALLRALERGTIAGAGLDVFLNEPDVNQTLVQHERVLATPHIAASTLDAQRAAGMEAARQVVEAIKKQSPAEALSLRLVPVEKVRPHERYHPLRVEQLAGSLEQDGMLANPPLVAELPDDQGYVILDGATRTTAFKKLGYPHLIVQVVDLQRDVQLYSWSHVVLDRNSNGSVQGLLETLRGIPGLGMEERPVADLSSAIQGEGALGALITKDNIGYLLTLAQESPGAGQDEWLDLQNQLVDTYGEWGDVERTLEHRMESLKAMYPTIAGLFVFPSYTAEMVMQVVMHGKHLPAGLTRFVIPGRILRLNAPLENLRSDESLVAKQDWLDQFIERKLGGRSVRYYEEPVMLLDE